MMATKAFRIRIAAFDDAPALLDIFQQCDPFAAKADHRNGITLVDVMDWLESATDQHPMLVVEYQGILIAWCSLEPFYGLPAFDLASEISLYVLPQWQRNGLGKMIFQHLEKSRSTIGFTHLIAYIYASNLNSQAFFTRQGFDQWGLLPNIAQNENIKEDVFLLGREFDESKYSYRA